ncbi:hypothetical protein CFL01nite_05810 [Corynebacterium flavescens]|uniref:Uncharacterized protein n=1 Tax=Corynebacterium flavescens TaxID=28028 RepID=A0AB73B6G4_CORFL|nr:hypothetical protein CFL01nite_05810 [Corynebacterium flavescens]
MEEIYAGAENTGSAGRRLPCREMDKAAANVFAPSRQRSEGVVQVFEQVDVEVLRGAAVSGELIVEKSLQVGD